MSLKQAHPASRLDQLLAIRAVLSARRPSVDDTRAAWIQKCRTSMEAWSTEALRPFNLRPAKHHRLLIEYLEKVLAYEIPRLLITMPPGSAKSTYATQLFPVHAMERFPRIQIIGASHTSDLALDFSTKIQNLIIENEGLLSYGLATENKERWYTTNGSSYLAAGVGKAIPGYRARIVIIDDPVKSRAAADSEVERKRVWEWYVGSLERRLTPNAAIIMIVTRWHEDDLPGRVLDVEADKWVHLNLPAEAEEDDPLGREPGDWLWNDDDYGYGATLPEIKARLERAGAAREWASQYQQRPRPQEGALFRVRMIGVLSAVPAGGKTVRGWDLASTKESGQRDPAWTRGVKLTMLPNRRLTVEDVVGVRGGPDDVERLILNTAGQDGKGVEISIPQDPGQAGVVQVSALIKLLHGYNVKFSPESGDKVERARPIVSQVNVGNFDIIEGVWNRSFLDELAAFPSGAKKDQVDALSRAYGALLEKGQPLILSPQQLIAASRMLPRDRFAIGRQRFARAR